MAFNSPPHVAPWQWHLARRCHFPDRSNPHEERAQASGVLPLLFWPPRRNFHRCPLLPRTQSYILRTTTFKQFVIITSRDNLASEQIARKCGFEYLGAPREDLVNRWFLCGMCLASHSRLTAQEARLRLRLTGQYHIPADSNPHEELERVSNVPPLLC